MRSSALLALGLAPYFIASTLPAQSVCNPVTTTVSITSTIPSSLGYPNSDVSSGNYEYVSVQGSGQIYTYDISSGIQLLVGSPYKTPCADPSGMVITTISGSKVMAVVCYDTGSLLTLTVNANGSLSALGSVNGLPNAYPGVVLDGTNVYVPLFGTSSSNGGVAKVSIASPATPAITATTTLASPTSGQVVSAAYLAIAGGYIYVTSGSESAPLSSSSSIQVVNEATMTLVGSPLVVPHSPQQIAIQGSVAYVTIYDAAQLESINISNPASLQPLQILTLTVNGQSCHAEPVIVQGTLAYIGCFAEGIIARYDVSTPSNIQQSNLLTGIAYPQRLAIAGSSLLVTSYTSGGHVYAISLGDFD